MRKRAVRITLDTQATDLPLRMLRGAVAIMVGDAPDVHGVRIAKVRDLEPLPETQENRKRDGRKSRSR